jgi:PAS domain S-box-containing protein
MGVNSAAEELLGWKPAELVGKVLEEGIQMRSFQAGDRTQVTFAMVLANRCNGLATLVDRHGRDVIVRVWASPILDKKNGSVAGVVLLMYRPGAPMMVPG